MPTRTFAFSGGVDDVAAYGDRWKIGFGGSWVFGDHWTVQVTSTEGDITWGVGDLGALIATVCFTYRDREYLGMGSQFNFSDNLDPSNPLTSGPMFWEIQDPGAGFEPYLSQFGGQDAITSLSQLQGRLAVFARKSIQIWIVDADPSQFSLAQTLDNIGTQAPLSTQNLGDLDVIFLDDTGFRSLRGQQITLNATIDDLGSPVDVLVQADLLTVSGSSAVGVVEPTTKNYWCFLNGKIYVFSRHTSSKILAWSQYLCTDDSGTVFTPQKFVVLNGRVYCRSVEQNLLLYGGSDNNTYDTSVVTVETPFLDDKRPATNKYGIGIDFAIAGAWNIYVATDPRSNAPQLVVGIGNGTNPAENSDSSYDIGRIAFSQQGTHFKMKAVSSNTSAKIAIISSLVYHYNEAERKA